MDKALSLYNGCWIDHILYFESKNVNGLFGLENATTFFINREDGVAAESHFLYSGVIPYNNSLISIPFLSGYIKITDIKNATCMYSEIDNSFHFTNGVIFHRWLVLISSKGFCRANLDDMREKDYCDAEISSMRDCVLLDKYLYVPSVKSDTLLKYDIEENKVYMLQLENNGINYNTIAVTNDRRFILSGNKSLMTIYDEAKETCCEIEIPVKKGNDIDRESLFSCSVNVDTHIYYAPLAAESGVVFDCEDNTVKKMSDRPHNLWCQGFVVNDTGDRLFMDFVDDDGKFRKSYITDMFGKELFENHICIDEKDMNKICVGVLNEGTIIGLEEFVDSI